MRFRRLLWLLLLPGAAAGALADTPATVTVARVGLAQATPSFAFQNVPAPQRGDAAEAAKFSLVDGEADANGGGIEKLHDGKLPSEQDDPAHNFFLRGGEGGRVLVDLGRAIEISEVNTFSWHPDVRGPQVYQLYASDGAGASFAPQPKRPLHPAEAGWTLLAKVDTRPSGGEPGGQYGVRISAPGGVLGLFRYLLFDMEPTQAGQGQTNTFYSEIDVREAHAPLGASAAADSPEKFEIEGGKYVVYLDTTETPELGTWARQELMPVVRQWYPKLVALMPSAGYTAPKRFSITFEKDRDGVAVTAGTRIFGAAKWYRQHLRDEAIGSIVHEMVHVVQQYGRGNRPPGWLIEGIPDYIRFFLYEPQTHGAEIPPSRAIGVRYDASYRTSANFLHWVSVKYDKDLVVKLNAAMRAGRYEAGLWQELTGHSVEELAQQWKEALAQASP